MERLSLKQYKQMIAEILEYKKLNGKMPDHVIVEEHKITKKMYIDMIDRVNKFILEMGRNPKTVDIESTKNFLNDLHYDNRKNKKIKKDVI